MEPVSLAIGVVPLVTNIVSTSTLIREKVAVYKSTSTDVQAIHDKLSLIIHICKRLQDEKNSPQHQGGELLERALEMCYSSVSSIHQELEKVASKEKGRRRNIEWVLRKSNIDKLIQGLNDSINMLNTYMNWSLLLSPVFQMDMTTKCNASLPTQERTPEELPLSPPRGTRRLRRTGAAKTRSTNYQNLLYLYNAAYTLQKREDDPEETQYRSYLFGLPILGAYFSLAVRHGSLSPWSFTIDTPRFIYEAENISLYESIFQDAPGSGASNTEVVLWLRRHKISANTQLIPGLRTRGNRMSLIGAMVAQKNSTVVNFLLDQDRRAAEDNQHFDGVVLGIDRDGDMKDFYLDPANVYAAMRGPLLTMAEYATLVNIDPRPACVESLFDLCKQDFVDDWNEFLIWTFAAFADEYITRLCILKHPENLHFYKNCSSLISKLVSHGLDIHSPLPKSYHLRNTGERIQRFYKLYDRPTALKLAMKQFWCDPFDTLDGAEAWLKNLELASIDVDKYLKTELDMEVETTDPDGLLQPQRTPSPANRVPVDWHLMGRRQKLEIIFIAFRPGDRLDLGLEDSDDLLQVMWVLRYGSGLAFDLLRGRDLCTHLHWKQAFERIYRSGKDGSWPFALSHHSPINFRREFKGLDEWTIEALEGYDHFIRLWDSRAEKRQHKKWQKLKKKNGLKECGPMPGAWELEWWDYQGPW